MIKGPAIVQWMQDLMAGRLRTPQAIVAASRAENPDAATFDNYFFVDRQDGPTWDVPQRLKAPQHILSDAGIRQWDRADYQHCNVDLVRWSAILIELARRRGIPLYVHCAFRTKEEQERVNASGNSKAAWPRSAHNIGEAVDVVHGVYHWTLTKQEWAFIHLLGLRALDLLNAGRKKDERLTLTWGGGWSFYDPAHWEIADYRNRIRKLETGKPLRRTPRFILRDVRYGGKSVIQDRSE